MKTLSATAMRGSVLDAFKSHPASVGETYVGHMGFALWFAGKLLLAGGAALTHAFIPFLFERTASDHIRDMYRRLENRHDAPEEN